MILLQLRANFGKLHGTLTLHEGLNELCLPNEAGKSTWSAFLLAMLYGIDTRERATRENQNLPAKERYRPWDGSSMEGAIDLIWNGRAVTIERRSQGRTPMGVFRAYETESGTPVPELTAENCGRTLCGAERSVFERTAFVRQLGMAVSSDAQRAQALHPAAQTRKAHRVRRARLIAVGKARQVLRSVIVQAGSGPPGQGQRLTPAEPLRPKAAAVARRIVIVRQ